MDSSLGAGLPQVVKGRVCCEDSAAAFSAGTDAPKCIISGHMSSEKC